MRGRLGQHFLVDPSICGRIVDAAGLSASDRVVEIGPGRGALTRALAGRAQVTAIELDASLAESLRGELAGLPGARVLHANFLRFPLESLPPPVKFVGNLPYSAATAMLMRIVAWDGWTESVLMFQKEVADRILASPGSRDYGSLTLAVSARAEAEPVLEAPPEAFSPRPKVHSSVVRLTRRPEPLVPAAEWPWFERVARAAFSQRRKTAANAIAAGLSVPRASVEAGLEACRLEPRARAESIPLAGFLALARSIRHA